jgi:hypothetical protein
LNVINLVLHLDSDARFARNAGWTRLFGLHIRKFLDLLEGYWLVAMLYFVYLESKILLLAVAAIGQLRIRPHLSLGELRERHVVVEIQMGGWEFARRSWRGLLLGRRLLLEYLGVHALQVQHLLIVSLCPLFVHIRVRVVRVRSINWS